MGKFITNSWENSNTWANLLQIHGQIQIHGLIYYKFMEKLKYMGKFITNSWENSNTWANVLQLQIHMGKFMSHRPRSRLKKKMLRMHWYLIMYL